MTDKITLDLTLDELKLIDKYVEYNEETKSVFDKIKYAYPQPQMNLQQEGDYVVVSYNDTTYYRFMNETTFAWYMKIEYSTPTLVMVTDVETERLLDGLYYNYIVVKKEKEMIRQNLKTSIRESVKWCEENPDKDPLDWVKPQTPEETEKSLREAFVEAQKTEKWKEIQKLIDEEDNDKNFKNSLDLIKEWGEKNKPKTLYEICMEWWDEVFVNQMDDNICVDVLVSKIDKEFIPPSSEKNGYEWEKCLKIMREKLR